MGAETEILIADDHPMFRSGLLDALRAEPSFRVVGEAGNGEEALRLIAELLPRVAVLDVRMPGLDGIEVAGRVREMRLQTEVVILTMYDDEATLNEALDRGVRGYVLKDSAATEIIGSVRAVLAGRNYISPAVSTYLVRRAEARDALVREFPALAELTPAEWRVLRLVAEYKTSKEIAAETGKNYRTVENQRGSISSKLNLQGSHSLLKFATENKSRLS